MFVVCWFLSIRALLHLAKNLQATMAPKRMNRGRKQQQAVYVEPVLTRPSSAIALSVVLRGKGRQVYQLPAFLNTSPWRVTSCDLSVASDNIGHVVVMLYAADVGNAMKNSLISMESREFVTSSTPQSLKLRNSARVEHGVSGAGANVLSVTFSEQVTGTAVGVVFVSVLGAI